MSALLSFMARVSGVLRILQAPKRGELRPGRAKRRDGIAGEGVALKLGGHGSTLIRGRLGFLGNVTHVFFAQLIQQEAQLSRRDCAMLRVIEFFAKSLVGL